LGTAIEVAEPLLALVRQIDVLLAPQSAEESLEIVFGWKLFV